jgi:hypothetical protein
MESGLNGVGEGGALARIGAGAAFAAESLSTTSCVPLTVTPPFATPPSTVRVSVTLLVWPFALSCAATWTSTTSVFGATSVERRPTSVPGIVTTTLSFFCSTDDPGMKRTTLLVVMPAACPMPLTMTASRAASSVNVTVACCIVSGDEGPVAVTDVCIPAATCTGATLVSEPNVRTTPSVVLTEVSPCASTRTWKAVPCTVLVEVGVTTA